MKSRKKNFETESLCIVFISPVKYFNGIRLLKRIPVKNNNEVD